MAGRRTVLAVARTVASTARVFDVLAALRGDTRVQVFFTVCGGSAFEDGVMEMLSEADARVVPWRQAVGTTFDLAISASHNGDLHKLRAPLIVVPHGAGYHKHRDPANGEAPLTRRELLRDGQMIATAVVLSHAEQLTRLARDCPEAVGAAVVAGDPCFDRLLASSSRRNRYRRALDVADGQRLVVFTSTWGSGSLLGRAPDLPARLLAALPADEYRVAAVLHPNVWSAHGGWQVRSWLAAAQEAGLLLIPPREGWRAALIAADCVLGDHGSVTFYAAAMGKPVLLGAFAVEEVVPDTPMAALGSVTPHLDAHRSLAEQISQTMTDTAVSASSTEFSGGAFAVAGESLHLLRELMYGLLELPEPPEPLSSLPVPNPAPERNDVTAYHVDTRLQPLGARTAVTLCRYPAAVTAVEAGSATRRHLAVDTGERDRRLQQSAAVLIRRHAAPTDPPGSAWTSQALEESLGAFLACDLTTPDGWLIRIRHGPLCRAEVEPTHWPGADPALVASAVYACLAAGHSADTLHRGFTVRVRGAAVVVRLSTVQASDSI